MGSEAQLKNVTNSLSTDRFSGRRTTLGNEPPLTDASGIQVAAVAVSAETRPVALFIRGPIVDGKCRTLIETNMMLCSDAISEQWGCR